MGQPRALETRGSATRHNIGDTLRRGVKLIGTSCLMKLPHMAVLFRGVEEVDMRGRPGYLSASVRASACNRQLTGSSLANISENC
jgi:hypothetical protein